VPLQTTKMYKNTKRGKRLGQAPRLRSGQAMLVAILMITAAALAIALAVATVNSSEVKSSVISQDANAAYYLAESCLENTLMRASRANLTLPPTLSEKQGTCTINIVGSAPYEVTAIGQVGRALRKVRATVSINNEVLNIQSWGETY